MEISSKYSPQDVEGKWYEHWMDKNYFHSTPDEREPYTIVIPPPNVTGVLHMGHMMNNTIQDILIRRARMQGKNACWVPGTDHASIATEAKVVNKLAQQGIKKTDIGREEFLKHAWDWTHEHGGIILKQLRRLGCSCDWERTSFTMDDIRSKSVIRAFVDLYNKGLIYRGVRMVNWDPKALTALSDEEVIFKEEHSKLYYLRYYLAPSTPPEGELSELPKLIDRYRTANPYSYAVLNEHAKEMRSNPTEAESALWEQLKGKKTGFKFRRQHIVGDFIVDFVCLEKHLIIEVDGGYHNDSQVAENDKLRSEILELKGYTILRFTNEQVLSDTENTLKAITHTLKSLPSGEVGGAKSSPSGGVEGASGEIGGAKSSPSGGVEGASGEVGGAPYAVVATTRPETIMGDTAMCINPADPKNQWLRGKKVVVPLVNRVIPVIEDDYVDIEFGTGCLKVTPAHDVNDYMLGEKHGLQSINIFNDDATISEAAGLYVGMTREDVRKQIVIDLKEAGLLEKIEDYNNKVGYSERTNVPIEPKLSMQWFLKMEHLADIALKPVLNGDIKFYPAKYVNLYRHWLENIKDWCISRQLWWGHQIPAWYFEWKTENGERKVDVIVAINKEEAEKIAIEKHGLSVFRSPFSVFRQDDDALDTWFSSWLWPLSLFNGILDPENAEFKYYYPTNDLITAPDIIFFWVARMIMAGEEYQGEVPFKNVYFTGIVRDKLGRKMSKSLGNSPDPIELIDKFGADGVRMGMMLSAPAGNDILFDEALCEQGRNFCNKIWNALRLVKGWNVDQDAAQPEAAKMAVKWFEARFNQVLAETNDNIDKYRLSDALMGIYKLTWDDFCSWYLEMVKAPQGQGIDPVTYAATIQFFENLMLLLHPFMPFITEEIWHAIAERSEGDDIIIAQQPKAQSVDEAILKQFEFTQEVINNVRKVRSDKNIAFRDAIQLVVKGTANKDFDCVIAKLCNVSEVSYVAEAPAGAFGFIVGSTEFFVPLTGSVDVEAEIKKLVEELKYAQGFLKSVEAKLSNERFVSGAPAAVVDKERKKKADAEAKIAVIEQQLAGLRK
ncbi:MAG: valine--tRNA ligase [Bacteroidales bacterium]|nr:valine--tRNA ligase [Bacteroidales bacterium]